MGKPQEHKGLWEYISS